jgi:crotonobetainyl-CoA:carnitine CoA-transferase CaiB-like acyl-CoA transferase
MPDTPSALAGIRVLDFSHALAGPYCTLLMSDYGADVYKLESPGAGDMGRGWGPPFVDGQASFFIGLNRGKRGIAIDLKRPEGLQLCLRLLDKIDVLVENFRPGTMERLGLGYSTVAERNPAVVYCSISGYGQNGPSRDETAMDLTVECSSGFMSITGTEQGEYVRSGYAVCDINAGLFATIGILMALRAREQTGRGQYVDIAMLDGMISAMSSNYMSFLGSGVVPRPLGSAFATVVPYRVFDARDGSFSVSIGSEKLWSVFCRAIQRPELELHPDFATNAARIENRRTLEAMLEAVFRARPVAEWVGRLKAAGIPCSPVRSFAEVVEDAQTAVRGMFPEIDCGGGSKQRVTGVPIKMSATPGQVRSRAPAAGEHTRAILRDLLGLGEAEIKALADARIVATG